MQTTENVAVAMEQISKARVQLIQNSPFFACLAMRLNFIPADVKTAVTNGIDVRFNPSYFNSLPVEELAGVIAHAVLHLAMLHHTRRDNRDLNKWNQATDYAINPLLREAKFTLPAGALESPDYVGMSAEHIYNQLPDPPSVKGDQEEKRDSDEDRDPNDDQNDDTGRKQSDDGNDYQNDPGDGADTTDDQDEDEEKDEDGDGGENPSMVDVQDPPPQTSKPEIEAEMKEAVSFAAVMARRAGEMTDGMDRFIQDILKPKVDWKEVLARFITEILPTDYTWTKPNTRYLHLGLFLPTLEAPEPGSVILMVDTSLSISEEMLNRVGAEAKEIADTFHIDLSIMYIDAEVKGLQHIERDEPMKLEPKGGGGTDFRPGFDYIQTNDLHPKAVVYLTDGYCSSFPEVPDFPVLWTLFEDMEFHPPFGEVLSIE